MNAKVALAAIKDVEKPRDRGRKDDERRGQKRERPNRRNNDGLRRKEDKGPRTVKFTLLIMHVDKNSNAD